MVSGSTRKACAEEPPAPTAPALAWRTHPRLRRHVLKLCDHPEPTAVLQRYRRSAETFSHAELVRHAVHVAAWVALLPSDTPVLPRCAELLAFLLRQWQRPGRIVLSPWLHGTLHLVALRALQLRQLCPQWLELKRSIPRRVWKDLCKECPPLPASRQVSNNSLSDTQTRPGQCSLEHHPEEEQQARANIAGTGRMTLTGIRQQQQLALVRMDAISSSQKDSEIAAVIQRAQDAMAAGDADAMLKAVVDVVGLLSAPRRAGVEATDNDEPMTEAAKEALRAAQQARLRSVLLQLLQGAAGLDLGDAGTRKLLALPMQRLSSLLGLGISDRDSPADGLLASAAQWSALRAQALALRHPVTAGHRPTTGVPPEEEAEQQQQRRHRTCLPLDIDSTAERLNPGDCPVQLAGSCSARLDQLNIESQFAETVSLSEPTPTPTVAHGTAFPCKLRAGRSTTRGVYVPNSRVKGLPCVQETARDVALLCTACSGGALTSRWVFARNGKQVTLVPFHGHSICGGGRYTSAEGLPCKGDRFAHLDFCPHDVQRQDCKHCGDGKNFCTHKRLRRGCGVFSEEGAAEAQKRVSFEVSQVTDIGIFTIVCKDTRRILAAKHGTAAHLLVEHLVRRMRKQMEDTLSDFQSLLAELCRAPRTAEELIEMRHATEATPKRVNALRDQIAIDVELFDTVESFRYRLGYEDIRQRWKLAAAPKQAMQEVARKLRSLQHHEAEFVRDLRNQQEEFMGFLEEIDTTIELLSRQPDYWDVARLKTIGDAVDSVKERITKAGQQARGLNSREVLLGRHQTDYSRVDQSAATFEPYCILWVTVRFWHTRREQWQSGSLAEVNAEEMEQQVSEGVVQLARVCQTFE
ncbi:unnamed protein product, partial [Polarella glacialis]